jgi:small nuclear ribonucleoprotein (snRNP)-like protein
MVKPTLATTEDQIQARVLVRLHGSEQVRTEFEAFDSTMRAFWAKAMELKWDTEDNRANVYLELEAERKKVSGALDVLATSMRNDLDRTLDAKPKK